MKNNIKNYLFEDITKIKGVGIKLKKYLKKKNIYKIKDLLLDLPFGVTDRSKIVSLDSLEIGKIATIKVEVKKYNFPRIRNLPNKVICSDGINKINIVFFNSNEYYIKKVLPFNKTVLISGKISYFKNNYQITNPTYLKPYSDKDEILQVFPKYTLTEGLAEKTYRKLIQDILTKINIIPDWHNDKFLKLNNFNSIEETFKNLHKTKHTIDIQSNNYRRLVFDEIFSNLLILLKSRKIVKNLKPEKKIFSKNLDNEINRNLPFKLTDGQKKILKQLDQDVSSKYRMFRLIQGDVGSGKTILALILALKVCKNNFQVAYMTPTEILSKQQFIYAKKLFKNFNINIELLTRSSKNKKDIIKNLKDGKIDFVIGTHSLFQKKILFKKLGLAIIDEQHKFGVKQRMSLAKKGGMNCDLLLMSATPIPRTMMMSIFGDMDISKLTEKPMGRRDISTYIKPESKLNEILPLLKKNIKNNQQIFWVCPLIEKSKKINFTSAVSKFNSIKKLFPDKVGLIHGNLSDDQKNLILNDFIKKKINILVSTTVIEVGIDIPSASTILIENANKLGLSQLHQLRGRVGRGSESSLCILLYNKNLAQMQKKD